MDMQRVQAWSAAEWAPAFFCPLIPSPCLRMVCVTSGEMETRPEFSSLPLLLLPPHSVQISAGLRVGICFSSC